MEIVSSGNQGNERRRRNTVVTGAVAICLPCFIFGLMAIVLNGCGGGEGPSTPAPTTTLTPGPTTTKTTQTTSTITTTPDAICRLSAREDTWCKIKTDASPSEVGDALQYICGDGGLSCSGCSNNDTHIFDTWAYNRYFQQHIERGHDACDFHGTGELSWPPYSPCIPGVEYATLCRPKDNADSKKLITALGYICSSKGFDCGPINPGGHCVFPEETDTIQKSAWAFNHYYQMHITDQGKAACDFHGIAELVENNGRCGKWNHGNPKTGKGYAYPEDACKKHGRGCITTEDGKLIGCRQCATKDPDDDNVLCPWIRSESEDEFLFAI